MKYFDIAVIGGGPAGTIAALTLSRIGHKVLLFDQVLPTSRFHIGEALPPAARQLLQKLGILEHFLKESHLPSYGNLFAWGSQKLENMDFILNPHGHGWHLNRIDFDNLLQRIAHDAGTRICIDKVDGVVIDGNEWHVSSHSSEHKDFRCKWIVDASGRQSSIAKKHGANRLHTDKLIAFFSFFYSDVKEDHDTRTLIESVPDGWWYTALIPHKKRVVVFLTDSDLVDGREILSCDGFISALNKTLHICKIIKEKRYALQDPIQGVDAGSSHLDKFVGHNWIAVGDAAMSFDPLSSQGILNAMYTGMKAGNALHMHLLGKHSMDDYVSNLDKIQHYYEQNRIKYYSTERRWRDNPFWKRRITETKTEKK